MQNFFLLKPLTNSWNFGKHKSSQTGASQTEKTKGEKQCREAFDKFLTEEGNLIFKRDLYACSSKERVILIEMARGLNSITPIAKALKSNPSVIGRLLSMQL